MTTDLGVPPTEPPSDPSEAPVTDPLAYQSPQSTFSREIEDQTQPTQRGTTPSQEISQYVKPRPRTNMPVTAQFSQWRQVSDWTRVGDAFQVLFGDTDIGPRVEYLIQQYPTATPDMVAGLAVSGYLEADDMLIDEIMQKDAAAQGSDNWLWNSLKWSSRNLFIVAEDLYNVNPLYVGGRTAVNTFQGEAFDESLNLSLETTTRARIRASRLGLKTDEGSGFIPSEELSVQSPEFWSNIQDMIREGTFNGSAQEQLIAAQNEAKLMDLRANGMNAFATTQAAWRSTVLYKTLDNGMIVSRPLSFGSAAAMPFTTPGTRAYEMTSSTFDIVARMTLEPTDIAFDAAFRQLGRAKMLIPDNALFGSGNFDAVRSSINEMFGINLHLGPIPEGRVGRMSQDARDEISGVTGTELDEFGNAPIDISAQAVANQYETLEGLSRNSVWDPNDPYAQGYIDAGFKSPAALIDEINSKGGLPGQLMLVVEHELVHDQVESSWFTVVETDGKRYIDYNTLSDAAPDELREIAREAPKQIQYESSQRVVTDVRQELQEAADQLTAAKKRVSTNPDITAEEVLEANTLISSLEYKVKELAGETRYAEQRLKEIVSERADNLAEQRKYVENHATKVSAENMRDGTWSAPDIYKAAKARKGITQVWRPWVNPKLYSEWLQGKEGQKVLALLANAKTYDKVDNILKGQLTPAVKLLIAETQDTGLIAKVIGKGMKDSPMQRPKMGRFYDLSSSGLDAWESSTLFSGGALGDSARRIARRAGAQGGYNILSVQNPEANLSAISNALRTAGSKESTIHSIQKMMIRNQGTVEGIAKVNDAILNEVIKQTKLRNGLQTAEEVKYLRDQWSLAQKQNRIYYADKSGNIRGFYHNGKMFLPDPDDPVRTGPQSAMMESQFSTTSLVIPNVRQLRRLTSQQRRAYEAIRSMMPDKMFQGEKYLPLGLESSAFMKIADWSFGIWRDMALFRVGWAFRILPEEHLRAAASGYSTMFNNPLDYFVALTNKMDVTLPGETQTIRDAVGSDGLGTAVLRAMEGDDAFTAERASWVIASVDLDPDLFWAGTTRAYVSMADDEITARLARDGIEEVTKWLETEGGKKVVQRVVDGAATKGGLDGLKDARVMRDYLDTQSLYIAEHTGGGGVYKNKADGLWYDSDGIQVTSFRRFGVDGTPTKFRNREELEAFIMERNGGVKPLTRYDRPQLEKMASDLAGYNIDLLENTKRVAHVSEPGDDVMRQIIGYKGATFSPYDEVAAGDRTKDLLENASGDQLVDELAANAAGPSVAEQKILGDISIDADMPFDEVRTIDGQLRSLFELRGITPRHTVPVPNDELIRGGIKKNPYRWTTDGFFKWFNAVPSTKFNRSPVFVQAIGRNIAEQYAFATPEVRAGLDAFMDANPDMRTAFNQGKIKVLRDWQWKEFPEASISDPYLDELDKAITHIDEGTVPDDFVTDENFVPGWEDDPESYNLTPLTIGGSDEQIQASEAFFKKLNEIGALLGEGKPRRGTYAFGGRRLEISFENVVLQGGASYTSKMDEVWELPIKWEQDLFSALGGDLNTGPLNFYQYMEYKLQLDTEKINDLHRSVQAKYRFAADADTPEGRAFKADVNRQIQDIIDEQSEYTAALNLSPESDVVASLQDKWARNNFPDYPTRDERKVLMKEHAQKIYDSQRGQTPADAGQSLDKSGGITHGFERIFQYIDKGGINPDALPTGSITPGNIPTGTVFFVDDFSPSQQRTLREYGDIEQTRALVDFGLDGIPGFDKVWGDLSLRNFPFAMTGRGQQFRRGELRQIKDVIENYRTPGILGKGAGKDASPIEQFMFFVKESRKQGLQTTFGIKGDNLLPKMKIDINGPLDEIEAAAKDMLSNKFMARLFGDTSNSKGLDNIFTEIEDAGITLTPEQRTGVMDLWGSHPWDMSEITVSDFGVMPVAMFTRPQLEILLEKKVMFTSNNALGDTAALMDTYLEDASVLDTVKGRELTFDPNPDVTPQMLVDEYSQPSTLDQRFEAQQADEQIKDLGYISDDPSGIGLDHYIEQQRERMWEFETDAAERRQFNDDLELTGQYADPAMGGLLGYDYAGWIDSAKMRSHWRKTLEGMKERGDSIPDVTDFMRLSVDDEIMYYETLERVIGELDYLVPAQASWGTFEEVWGAPYARGDLTMKETYAIFADYLDGHIRKLDRAYEDLMVIQKSNLDRTSPFFGKQVKKQDVLPQQQTDNLRAITESIEFPPGSEASTDLIREELVKVEREFFDWMEARGKKYYRPDLSPDKTRNLEDLRDRADLLNVPMDDAATYKFDFDPSSVPFDKRQETTQRMLGIENYRYNWMESGDPKNAIPRGEGLTPQNLNTAQTVEQMLKGSKEAAIQEVKDLFYDLTNKSNIADAYRLLFPFGDAWYEVLSRWAKIMNPAQSGSQPFRNVRRMQVSMMNARKDGFLSTNEFGEEVFNWPGLGSMIPGLDGSPISLSSVMPISSLMFIDPSARGVEGPSMAPWVQLGARIAQPALDQLPILRDMTNYAVYGGADQYQPGTVTSIGDLAESFMPTPLRRVWAMALGDESREVYGNTKLRIFEGALASGDPKYNAADPAGVKRAWEFANTTGTWLSVLRIFESAIFPGQPQYQPELKRIILEGYEGPPGDPTISIVRLANEYRHANNLWGRAEADFYMIERFGLNPVFLQSMTAGIVEKPATWEAVNYFAANDWILDVSPLTAAATIPTDTETFSQRAWQDNKLDRVVVGGVEGPLIREEKSALSIAEAIQRSQGYEMLRFQDAVYEKTLTALRNVYGENYASNPEYRLKKDRLDRNKRDNRRDIMAQYPVVESLNAGDILGETQGTTGARLLQEITDVGTEGTKANAAYRENIPAVADVAERFTSWFTKLEAISMKQDKGTASPIWWLRSTTTKAQLIRSTFAKDVQRYVSAIADTQAKDYAIWIVKRIVDPFLDDWEWINQEFAPQLASWPTLGSGG